MLLPEVSVGQQAEVPQIFLHAATPFLSNSRADTISTGHSFPVPGSNNRSTSSAAFSSLAVGSPGLQPVPAQSLPDMASGQARVSAHHSDSPPFRRAHTASATHPATCSIARFRREKEAAFSEEKLNRPPHVLSSAAASGRGKITAQPSRIPRCRAITRCPASWMAARLRSHAITLAGVGRSAPPTQKRSVMPPPLLGNAPMALSASGSSLPTDCRAQPAGSPHADSRGGQT